MVRLPEAELGQWARGKEVILKHISCLLAGFIFGYGVRYIQNYIWVREYKNRKQVMGFSNDQEI